MNMTQDMNSSKNQGPGRVQGIENPKYRGAKTKTTLRNDFALGSARRVTAARWGIRGCPVHARFPRTRERDLRRDRGGAGAQ